MTIKSCRAKQRPNDDGIKSPRDIAKSSQNLDMLTLGSTVSILSSVGRRLEGKIVAEDGRWGGTWTVEAIFSEDFGKVERNPFNANNGEGRSFVKGWLILGPGQTAEARAAEEAKKVAEAQAAAERQAAFEAREARIAELAKRLPSDETLGAMLVEAARETAPSLATEAPTLSVTNSREKFRFAFIVDRSEIVEIRGRLDRWLVSGAAWVLEIGASNAREMTPAQARLHGQTLLAASLFVERLSAILADPQPSPAKAEIAKTEEASAPLDNQTREAIVDCFRDAMRSAQPKNHLTQALKTAIETAKTEEAAPVAEASVALEEAEQIVLPANQPAPQVATDTRGKHQAAEPKRFWVAASWQLGRSAAASVPCDGAPLCASADEAVARLGEVEGWGLVALFEAPANHSGSHINEATREGWRYAGPGCNQDTMRTADWDEKRQKWVPLGSLVKKAPKRREVRAPKSEKRSSAAIVELPPSILGVSLEDEPADGSPEQDAWLDKKLAAVQAAQLRLPRIVARLEAEEYGEECWGCWKEGQREHTSVYGDTLAEAITNLLSAENTELTEGTCASVLCFRWEGSFRQRENIFWTAQGEFNPLAPIQPLNETENAVLVVAEALPEPEPAILIQDEADGGCGVSLGSHLQPSEAWFRLAIWDADKGRWIVPSGAKRALWNLMRREFVGCIARGPKGLFEIA